MYDPIVYSLEKPKLHLLEIGKVNLFSGWVFNFGKKNIDSLTVYADRQLLGNFPVNGPRQDIGSNIPSIKAAKTCGFSFELEVSHEYNNLTIELIFDDQTRELFLALDLAQLNKQQRYFNHLKNQVALYPQPDPELVFLTQGHSKVEEYKNSIIPGVMNLQEYLKHAGVDIKNIRSILDFGCGSGRLLLGWHLLFPHIELSGCDINAQLCHWIQDNLSTYINCLHNNVSPPLPYSDNQFDFIYLISVFTHLPLEVQKQWLQEFKRMIKPGGLILLTLHGEIYVHNTFWQATDKIQEFQKTGIVELGHDSGSNDYAAFHSLEFITKLMHEFELVSYFPNGNLGNKRPYFKTAMTQDVYIFRYNGTEKQTN